jgi:Zn-dependent protease
MLGGGAFVAPDNAGFSHVVGVPPGTPDGSLLYPAAFTLSVALNLNLLLFLFNLIPLPPLDGSGVLQGLFPATAGRLFDALSGNPMLSLLGLLVAWRIFGYIFGPAFGMLLALLHPGVSYS